MCWVISAAAVGVKSPSGGVAHMRMWYGWGVAGTTVADFVIARTCGMTCGSWVLGVY